MKILVTGGTGFLGRRTVAHFATLGCQVLAPNRRELDITNGAAASAWFRENRPQAVIHTAAVSDTALCQREPVWSEQINVAGCAHLARACREFGAKLVMCSSDQVYFGSAAPGPHDEGRKLTPANVYGCQKLRAEQETLAILPDAVCLRLSWMYARNSLAGEHGHFWSGLTAALADDSKPLAWPVYDRRGLTDVAYVVERLPQALELPGGVWNFGSENHRNTYLTVKNALEKVGLSEALARLRPNEEAFAGDPRDITMDMSRLRQAGIDFPTTGEGLCRALEEWKQVHYRE